MHELHFITSWNNINSFIAEVIGSMFNKANLLKLLNIKIQDHQCMMSYDVHSLFTSIPIDPAISIIRRQLEQDKDLHQRTNMTVNHICCRLEFCLKNTFFK